MPEYAKTALSSRISDRMFAFLLLLPAMIAIVFIIIVPLLTAVYTSFFRYFLTDSRGMEFVGFKNYIRMFSRDSFWRAFLNTIYYVGGCVIGEFILGFTLALLVNFSFRGKNIINSLFFIPWIIPSVVVALITKSLFFDHYHGIINVVFQRIGLINEFLPWLKDPHLAMPSIITATIWKMFPFMFVLLYAGLQAVPVSEIEAAKIDGANAFQRFIHVIIPNMREIIALVTVLEFIWMFQYMTIIWTTTKGGPADVTTTLPVLIYRVSFKGSLNMGYSSAVGIFWMAFLLCFSIVYVKLIGKEER